MKIAKKKKEKSQDGKKENTDDERIQYKNENIQKKEGGPGRPVSGNQSSSVTLNELARKARKSYCNLGRRRGLVVERRTPGREVGVRSSLRSPCCVIEQDTFTSQKVMVIPRKRWLRSDMTEKLLTGTLNLNKTKHTVISSFNKEVIQ